MSRQNNQGFATVKTEGLLLPPELIARVADLEAKLPGIRPEDYNLPKGERINEATNRAWNRLTALWARFRKEMEALPESEAATGPTRERWLLPLFQELGYGRLQRHTAFEIEGKSYAISHLWGHAPIHLVGARLDLDKRTSGQVGAAQASPHGLLQQFLNRTDAHLWAFLSNGLKLRILRDNLSLTRQAYVEFDLAAMMDGELYSDFRLLWLLCHQSRVESERPEQCWLEKWTQEAREHGARALEHLREGVENAIRALGSGFLAHPANTGLQERLTSGELEAQDYYRQLLRLVYRLIFLFVAEDRDLLLTGDDEPAERRYSDYYSTARLRRIAHRLKGSRHEDLYESLKVVMAKLHEQGCPELALPALGSFLWDPDKLPDLSAAHIRNRDFLEAVRALAFVQQERTLRPIDYRNLGPEELGSVYESLLELHPELHREAATFELRTAAGSERKTTGSYYTPESLIQELLNSALDPVLDRAASQLEPEQAILNLKVCDPAAGSGHFLVAAAHRIARRLAAVRSGDEEPAPGEVTLALRDVVSHCLYGVDINEMAVELCKVSLWMTAMAPGRPLSFLDHRIRYGNSLLGATPALMSKGIPDEAFKPIIGDNKEVSKEFKARNKKERKSKIGDLFHQGKSSWERLCRLSDAVNRMDRIGNDHIPEVREQAAMYASVAESEECRHSHLIANAWCAAFVWKKYENPNLPYSITEAVFRRLEESSDKCPDWMRREIQHFASQYRFFHWHLEFPNVFRTLAKGDKSVYSSTGWSGGFDCVIGNPPWERTAVEDTEFFACRLPEILKTRTTAARKRAIEKLKDDAPKIYEDYVDHKRKAAGDNRLYSDSGRFPLGATGRLNTYALFTDLNISLLSESGRAGIIVPTNIAIDAPMENFWGFLIEERRLVKIVDFENKKRIFPAVHPEQKFCLLTLTGKKRSPDANVHAGFWLHELEQLNSKERVYKLPLASLRCVSPNTGQPLLSRTLQDFEISKAVYSNWPILYNKKEKSPFARAWRALMTAGSSQYFRTLEELSDGIMRSDGLIDKNNAQFLPLIESKLIHQFEYCYASYEYTTADEIKKGNPHPLLAHKRTSNGRPVPRFWAERSIVEKMYTDKQWNRKWIAAVRDVTNTNNERTAIACILPRVGILQPLNAVSCSNAVEAGITVAAVNSFLVDFIARQRFTGRHLNVTTFSQLPRPDQGPAWLFNLVKLAVLELTYAYLDLVGFAEEYGYKGPPFRWDKDRRFLIRCELDAAFFHLYLLADDYGDWRPTHRANGFPHDETPVQLAELKKYFPTPRDAVSYIMETFPIVKRKDTQKYGEYHTKLVILDIYDKMKTAMETGEPYQTLLDPPPGDPRAAHLPKGQKRPAGEAYELTDLQDLDLAGETVSVRVTNGAGETEEMPFHFLSPGDPTPDKNQVVILRHPDLRQGDTSRPIAVGKFLWSRQQDVATGEPIVAVTLRGFGPPASLRLTEAQWSNFLPLAVAKT